jgi:hypothetical protein
MEAAKAARAAADSALEACRSELSLAVAKAAAAADDAAKWQGTAGALEGRVQQLAAAAEAAQQQARGATEELAAKDERIAEMRWVRNRHACQKESAIVCLWCAAGMRELC